MSPKRSQSLGKSIRFEIFKRDSFTCQYCGRKPPSVILEVDHILPVSKGGNCDSLNLITSCYDCNRGKRAKLLGDQITPLKAAMESEREKFDQLMGYQELLAEKARLTECWFKMVSDTWITREGKNPNRLIISGDVGIAVRRFLKLLPPHEIIEAVDIAFDRMARKSEYARFKFFCGVCWKMVNGNEAIRNHP